MNDPETESRDNPLACSTKPSRKKILSRILRNMARFTIASAALAAPIAAYQSGGAVLSTREVSAESCIAQREFSLLGIFAFHYDSYDKECGEAKAVLAIMNSGVALNDVGMIATSLSIWRKQYPRLNDAMSEISEKLLKNVSSKKSP